VKGFAMGLRFGSAARCGGGFATSGCEFGVVVFQTRRFDSLKKLLHNLVSLLLTQRCGEKQVVQNTVRFVGRLGNGVVVRSLQSLFFKN